jgi:hypothetical protein
MHSLLNDAMKDQLMMNAEQSRMPIRLAVALDALTQAAVKLRAFASPGDVEDGASAIGEMLHTLRGELEKLRTIDDRCERMVLAEQMASFAEVLASSAQLLRDTTGPEGRPSDRAAVDVAFHGMRLALALRCMGSPIVSLAVH